MLSISGETLKKQHRPRETSVNCKGCLRPRSGMSLDFALVPITPQMDFFETTPTSAIHAVLTNRKVGSGRRPGPSTLPTASEASLEIGLGGFDFGGFGGHGLYQDHTTIHH